MRRKKDRQKSSPEQRLAYVADQAMLARSSNTFVINALLSRKMIMLGAENYEGLAGDGLLSKGLMDVFRDNSDDDLNFEVFGCFPRTREELFNGGLWLRKSSPERHHPEGLTAGLSCLGPGRISKQRKLRFTFGISLIFVLNSVLKIA